MSGLRVNTLRGETAGSSPTFPDGVVVTGVITATSFSGNLTGDVTGNVVGNVTGDVTGNITGTTGTFSGNVSVGGTLTYEDVTNVDSVGVITARSGIRIGAGQSVSAVSGIVTYYGDGSQLTGVESGVGNFVASGTIPNGATVVIKTDGTVGIVTQTTSSTPSVTSPTVFDSAETATIRSTFDSTNGKVIITYKDKDNNDYGTAIVGTVSGDTISFGTAVVFNSSAHNHCGLAYDSTNEKVVVAYSAGNPGNASAKVGTVSGTSISFGSATSVGGNSEEYISIVFDSNSDKVVISYKEGNSTNNYRGRSVVGTVSGTSISFGSHVTYETNRTDYPTSTFDSTNNKVVIAYTLGGSGASFDGKAIVGTVSGTSISFGTAVTFSTGYIQDYQNGGVIFDSTNGKVVIGYKNEDNNNYGEAIVGTVSGTSISFGTAVVFESASIGEVTAAYDTTNQRVVIVYKTSSIGKAIVGTVSGTSISFGSATTYQVASVGQNSSTYDSTNGKVVISYIHSSDSEKGKSVLFSALSVSTNLTSENYIGIAAEAISNTATGKVNILGGVNTGQTGLTTAQTYYVQGNGTLATSAGSPSVVAGTSISSTKVLIWKS